LENTNKIMRNSKGPLRRCPLHKKSCIALVFAIERGEKALLLSANTPLASVHVYEPWLPSPAFSAHNRMIEAFNPPTDDMSKTTTVIREHFFAMPFRLFLSL